MFYNKSFRWFIGSVFFSGVVCANNQQQVQLDEMVITATRTSVPVASSLSSVSIITREDIETYQYKTVAEALQGLAGVLISNSGGLGKQTSLFLRGTESNHTQILLNGVKLPANEFGMAQFEHIPLGAIERIELTRGPQSSLYGSSSVGGTIQIFTRSASLSPGLTPMASFSLASHNSKETRLGISFRADKAWFNVNAGYMTSDGIDSCDGKSAILLTGCFADQSDHDGYNNRNSSIRAGLNLSSQTHVELFSLYSEGKTEYDGFYTATDFRQYTYGATINSNLTDSWELKTSLSHGQLDSDQSGSENNSVRNTKNMFSLQNNIELDGNRVLTLGYDYEDDKYRSNSPSVVRQRDNSGYFSQLHGMYKRFDYRLSYRYDNNEQYGNVHSGSAAWGISFSNSVRAYLSYGKAFTAPGFIDLEPSAFGNPDLRPEKSKSVELGLSGQHEEINWSAAFYRTKIDDLIVLDNTFVPQNISQAVIKGIELTAQTTLPGLKLGGQVSLSDPENRSDDANRGNLLARRAKKTITLNAAKSWNRYNLSARLYYVGKRYDNSANSRILSAFTTIDLVAGYKLNNDIDIKLRLANIFDEEYETAAGYNSDDTNVILTLNYAPR